MALLYGKLEEFNNAVESWRSYMERVEDFFEVNEVPAEKQVKALLSSVGGKTYTVLRKLTVPDRPSTKTLAQINKLLCEHYHPKPLVIGERFRFHKRDQKPSETVPNYIAALRELSEHCEFGAFLDEALRDRFVCGLFNEAIQTRLLSERNLTLVRAVEIANAMDTASHDAEEFQGRTSLSIKKFNYKDNARKTPVQSDTKPNQMACYRCGSTDGHKANTCRFVNTKCSNCGKIGHLKRVCLSRSISVKQKGKDTRNDTRIKAIAETSSGSESETDMSDLIAKVKINSVFGGEPIKEMWVSPKINNVLVKMELDTGSPVAIMPEWLFIKHFTNQVKLKYSSRKLVTYNNSDLQLRGVAHVNVCLNGKSANLPLYVTRQGNTALMGREWLAVLCPNWYKINSVCEESISVPKKEQLQLLLKQYHEIFDDTLGKIPNIKAKIYMKDNAKPVYCKARLVPYSLKPEVEKELMRLEQEGIITQIPYSDWATPIVPILKADGSVRICGDFKTTVNPNLLIEHYPLPRIEDLFANLSGGRLFSKIDLKQAYHQMELDEEAKKLLVINTSKGLFKYNRLVFGISSAPAIWQKTMEQLLQGIKGIQILQDDILITGENTEAHFKNLEEVMKRIQENGLRVNKKKCEFFKGSVKFCGHKIDAQGLHKTDEKIRAVQDFCKPRNTSEMRSFLGLINYYGRFIKNASTILNPLNELLEKKKEFVWTQECEKAFNHAKDVIASDKILVHYNPKLPLKLDCDASPVGLGCVLSHVMSDGTDRPIAYASRTLTASERNYAQIDKEALAIIWGIKKFNIYLYGQHFNLVTDHEPLTSIFHPHKAIPVTTAARLQRYAVFLSGYDYSITYRRSRDHGNADGLSRLPVYEEPDVHDRYTNKALEVLHLKQMHMIPVKVEEVKQETLKDPVMSKVFTLIQQGWGTCCSEKNLVPYFIRRNELSIQHNVIMWGIRVLIPPKLQERVLEELHSGHIGIVKMKSLARSYVWWPKMDGDIEDIAKTCSGCRIAQKMPEKAPLHPWEYPLTPWRRVHADFAGPFMDKMFFVLQDAHSKWPEVVIMKSSTSEKTVEVLHEIFSRNGIPETLVTDNGPQFTSEQFKQFIRSNGLKHHTSPPYHPATNGLAERFVETLKNALKAMKEDKELTLKEKVARLLMAYRNSPHSTTHEKPSKLFFNRHIKIRLDLLKPNLQECPHKTISNRDHSRLRSFGVGQAVLARGYGSHEKWLPGKVQKKTGPLTYVISLNNGLTWRRHINQLLETKERKKELIIHNRPMEDQPEIELDRNSFEIEQDRKSNSVLEPGVEESISEHEKKGPGATGVEHSKEEVVLPTTPSKRYPTRIRKATKRLICEDI